MTWCFCPMIPKKVFQNESGLLVVCLVILNTFLPTPVNLSNGNLEHFRNNIILF